MENSKKGNQEYYVIDLLHILKSLWSKAWAIILIGIVTGAMALCYTVFMVVPKYSASVMMYVNNSSFSVGNVSITASELSAAQSLVDTYIVILNNTTTMEEVAERLDSEHSAGELMGMIKAEPVSGTEVFRITVTTDDPYEAAEIANCIAEVLPLRVDEIIEGSSTKLVDSARVNTHKVSPNITQITAIGAILGCLLACVLFAVIALFDDTIRNEDNIVQTYDVPVLAKIPDLTYDGSGHGYHYYKYGRYSSYGYGSKQKDEKKGGVSNEQ